MLTIDLLKEMFSVKEDQELAALLGKSPAAISKWRNNGEVPALAERQALSILQKGGYATAINGNSHHIDIHHAADPAEPYSPATSTLLDIIGEWSEKKRRKLLGIAITWNGDEDEGTEG